jgi:hypothetical protein
MALSIEVNTTLFQRILLFNTISAEKVINKGNSSKACFNRSGQKKEEMVDMSVLSEG